MDRIRSLDLGDIGDNGEEIVAIISKEEGFVVYCTRGGKVCFDATSRVMNKNKKEIEVFDRINSKIFDLLPPRFQKYPARQVGYALASSFVYDGEEGMSLLQNAEAIVDDKLNEIVRLYFVASVLFLGSIILALFYINTRLLLHVFNQEQVTILRYGAIGVLGGVISVMQRIHEVSVQGYYSKWYIFLLGTIRVLVAFLFGILSYFLVTGNIIFGFLSASSHGMFLAALIAGFNERIIPDILNKTPV